MKHFLPTDSAPADSGWQPIETAPLHGGWVLLADRDGMVAYGFWSHPRWHFADETVWVEAVQDDFCTINSWREGSGPTHWMPLPKPPVQS